MSARLALLLLVLVLVAPAAGADPARLDARLRMLLEGAAKTAADASCLVRVSDDGRELTAWLATAGGRVRSAHGAVRTVTVPAARLSALGRLPSVVWVEADQPLRPRLEVARGAAGVNVTGLERARAAEGRPAALTGKGVLVGIIDAGFDTAIPALKDERGRTRIVAIWDQQHAGQGGTAPVVRGADGVVRTLGPGRVFTAADIDGGVYRNADADGHGTAVASCALGRDDVHGGVAPEARLLCVACDDGAHGNSQTAGTTLDAVAWLRAEARRLGRPLVVNLSFGSNFGPHDGTTLFEQALQADIDDGLILTVSAGNAGDQNAHARIQAPAHESGSLRAFLNDVGTRGDPPKATYNAIDLWFDARARPAITVTRYDDTFTTSLGSTGPIAFEEEGTRSGPGFTVLVKKDSPYAFRGKPLRNHVLLVLHAGRRTAWQVDVANPGDTGFEVDAYIESQDAADGAAASALSPFSPVATVECPGTTPGAITVGAYANRSAEGLAAGDLAPFSARGPLFDGAGLYRGLDAVKPDVCAPGASVYVARTAAAGGGYTLDNGTSLSAPIVAGVVALVLQENPSARPSEVKRILSQSARPSGVVPDPGWGWGKVDAQAALRLVVSPRPRLDAAVREAPTRLHLRGNDIARSSEVRVNGQAVPPDVVEWEDDDDVFVTVAADLVVHEVTVENLLAEKGDSSATLSLDGPAAAPVASGGAAAPAVPAGGGCFIATAAWGSYLDPHVVVLRQFRDRWLLTWGGGRWLVSLYYAASPPLADVIARHEGLRAVTRVALTPLVLGVEYPVVVLALTVVIAFRWRRLQWAVRAAREGKPRVRP